jgi:sarcosine oxidase subunit alpha
MTQHPARHYARPVLPHRFAAPSDPVEVAHDGEPVVAQRGEPLVFALIAADRLPIARSPKLHRPRGPYCLRGGCDGCLARVDGVPNVMTCQKLARGGEEIETQNVLGTRGVDALRAADFLFPKGIDHHRLFAGIRGVSGMVQTFARQVAGLGRLPDEVEAIRDAERRDVDVLVVGAGRTGLELGAALGGRALVVNDGPHLGGSLAALDPAAADEAVRRAGARGAELRASTMAVGLFREPETSDGGIQAVLLGPRGATLVFAKRVVLATGCHDPVVPFGENDLPGVISARAALSLWNGGIALGQRLALVGSGRFLDAFAERVGETPLVRHALSEVIRAAGRSKVTAIVVRDGDRERREKVDAIVLDAPGAPALELGVQAGAAARFHPEHGYILSEAAGGSLGPGLYACGSVLAGHAGAPAAPAVAARVLDSLR